MKIEDSPSVKVAKFNGLDAEAFFNQQSWKCNTGSSFASLSATRIPSAGQTPTHHDLFIGSNHEELLDYLFKLGAFITHSIDALTTQMAKVSVENKPLDLSSYESPEPKITALDRYFSPAARESLDKLRTSQSSVKA